MRQQVRAVDPDLPIYNVRTMAQRVDESLARRRFAMLLLSLFAGLAFGQQAAEGALFGELAELIGPESAEAVQAMLRSASGTQSGIFATAVGIGALIIANHRRRRRVG